MPVRPMIDSAEKALRDAQEALSEKREQIRARRRAAWVAAGGCTRCNGDGRMITASYSDGEVETAPCVGHKAGDVWHAPFSTSPDGVVTIGALRTDLPLDVFRVMPAAPYYPLGSRYELVRDIPCTAHEMAPWCANADTAEDLQDLADLQEQIDIAKELLDAARRDATPHKGATVKVVRGRKVPIGTVGVVVWEGESVYGRRATHRIGIRVEGSKELLYTAADNCDVTTVSVDVVAPMLYGTPKQRAWAEKIRRDAMTDGLVDDATVERESTARFWIDNRERFARKGNAA